MTSNCGTKPADRQSDYKTSISFRLTIPHYRPTPRGVARVRHMGPRPQPQRLCPLKFHKLALGAATLSRNCRTLKIGLATPLPTPLLPLPCRPISSLSSHSPSINRIESADLPLANPNSPLLPTPPQPPTIPQYRLTPLLFLLYFPLILILIFLLPSCLTPASPEQCSQAYLQCLLYIFVIFFLLTSTGCLFNIVSSLKFSS